MAQLNFNLDTTGGGTKDSVSLDFSFDKSPFKPVEREKFDLKETLTGVVKFGTELAPYGRYLWKEEREKYGRMSSGEKMMAHGWEGLSFLFWWKGPAIAKGAFKLIGKGAGKVTGGRIGKKVIQPIEDLIDIKSKSYAQLASSKLTSKGFKQDEIPAVIDAARGNNFSLLGAYSEQAAAGKSMSRGWQKNIRVARTPGDISYQFAPADDLLKELVPETLRRKAHEGSIRKQIGLVFKEGEKYNANEIFARHAKKYTGGEGIVKMKDATDDLVFNVLRDMQDSPRLLIKLATTAGPFASMRPMQSVWGDLDRLWGTMEGVYIPASRSVEGGANFKVQFASLLNRMKAERGFGSIVSKTDRAGHLYEKFKPAKFYTKEFKQQTNEFMHSVRDMMQTIGNEQLDDAGRIMSLRDKTAIVNQKILDARDAAPKMVDLAETLWDFNNKLFEVGLVPEIERAFLKAGINSMGMGVLRHSFKEIQNTGRLRNIFNVLRKETDVLGRSTIDVKNPFRRSEEIKDLLVDFQDLIKHTVTNPAFRDPKNPAMAVNAMFNQTGDDLLNSLDNLMGELTMKKGGDKYGFTNYLEGYFARIGKGGRIMPQRAIDDLPIEMKAAFTRETTLDVAKQPLLGLDEAMASRINAQGNEMYLYPAIREISETAQRYPKVIRKHVEHYLKRLAGLPSAADDAAARWLNHMPGIKGWDGHRVRALGGVINDFTYMGFLGLKPFSAMRNTFQPFINVPAELGGLWSFNNLFRGYYKVLTSSARRSKLRGMGLITEYAPEIMHTTGLRNKVREGAMWMFRWSDEGNRLITGSAALDKWERAVLKMPEIREGKNIAKFMQKSGANLRRPWIAKDIEKALTRRPHGSRIIPDMIAAERLYVRDATAVTQYLYGSLDAPLITQIGGIFGRTGAIFQSWWMNYGDMIMRWYTGGQKPSVKVQRSFNFAVSAGLSWMAMNQMWGAATATRTVGLGPFPKSMVIPPTWEPVFKMMQVITTAGETAFTQDPEKLGRDAMALLKTSFNFIPGGVQGRQLWEGGQREGMKGFLKAIGKLK
jgi:hypothetical protein